MLITKYKLNVLSLSDKITLRIAFLLFIPLALTCWYFVYIKNLTEIKLNFIDTVGKSIVDVTELFNKKQTNLNDFGENLSSFTKIPTSLLRFQIYAQNNVMAENGNSTIKTAMNTDVSGTYVHGIKTGELRKVFKRNIKAEDFFNQSSVVSFEIAENNNLVNTIVRRENAYYSFFLWPTFFSFLLVLVVIIGLTYASIVVLGLWLKFVLLGSPITEVLSEFKKK